MWTVLLALSSLLSETPAADTVKIAVLPTAVDASAKGQVPPIIDEYVLTAVHNRVGATVIGPEDVNALIGFEKQKELVGCDDVNCMAEIAGALGVDLLVVLRVARVEERWATTAKLIDLRAVEVEARTAGFVNGGSTELLAAVPQIIADLFDSPAGGPTRPAAAHTAPTSAPPWPATPAAPSPPSPPAREAPFAPVPAPDSGGGGRTAWIIGGSLLAIGVLVLGIVLATKKSNDFEDNIAANQL
jgi:hypothetical protein